MKDGIYLDYAASTPVDSDVMKTALPYYTELFYNPASGHAAGQKAAAAVERSREKCAAAIDASPSEIYFTSGGTEAVNWAMSGVAGKRKHIVISSIEHDSVWECADRLEKNGYTADRIKPDANGIIRPEDLKKIVRSDTGLVCVMTVNNIVGSIQPIKELAAIAHANGALFFTDAVQAVNSVRIDVKDTGVDMLAVSGHKFYAPKGVGFLYVKNGTEISPLLYGGEQERGLRPGTVDVPSVAAMGEAAERAAAYREKYNAHIKNMRAEFLRTLDHGTPVICSRYVDDIVSVVFDGVDGGRLAVALSCAGVYCSVGSACSAGSATPPRTLIEMGVKNARSSVRFSFGKYTTSEQVRAAARTVNETVKRLS